MENNNNLFDLVNQIKNGKRTADIQSGTPELTIYSKLFVQKGPLKKEYLLRFNVEVNHNTKTISTYDSDCYDSVTYINGLHIYEDKLKESLDAIGLGGYKSIFDNQNSDWDTVNIFEDCLRLEPLLKEMYFNRGYAYYQTLTEEQKLNVKEGLIWNTIRDI